MQQQYFRLITGRIEKATADSAAFDIFADESVIVGNKPIAVQTGIRTIFSPNLVAIIKEKSGLALKGLEIKAGVIDSDFLDPWKVICRFPSNDGYYQIEKGDKIAQFILILLPEIPYHADPGADISIKADIRKGGFGSTGPK